jgi:hypothetical protein
MHHVAVQERIPILPKAEHLSNTLDKKPPGAQGATVKMHPFLSYSSRFNSYNASP